MEKVKGITFKTRISQFEKLLQELVNGKFAYLSSY